MVSWLHRGETSKMEGVILCVKSGSEARLNVAFTDLSTKVWNLDASCFSSVVVEEQKLMKMEEHWGLICEQRCLNPMWPMWLQQHRVCVCLLKTVKQSHLIAVFSARSQELCNIIIVYCAFTSSQNVQRLNWYMKGVWIDVIGFSSLLCV